MVCKALIQRRQWQPTPILLPGKSHGQRNLVGYSPKVRKESDTTEQLSTRPWVVRFQPTFSTNVAHFCAHLLPWAILTPFHFLPLMGLWTGCSQCLNVPFPHHLPGFLLIQPLTQRHLPYPSSLDPHLSPSHHATDDHFLSHKTVHLLCIIVTGHA